MVNNFFFFIFSYPFVNFYWLHNYIMLFFLFFLVNKKYGFYFIDKGSFSCSFFYLNIYKKLYSYYFKKTFRGMSLLVYTPLIKSLKSLIFIRVIGLILFILLFFIWITYIILHSLMN